MTPPGDGSPRFEFVQFEFGWLLGPPDGRYLHRREEGSDPERVVVLGTLGAKQRRLIGRDRPRSIEAAEAEPVPTQRATLIAADPFATEDEAEGWLARVRRDKEVRAETLAKATAQLNGVLRAWRAAAWDPYVGDVTPERALAVRAGYGSGDEVANGRFSAAYSLPPGEKARRRRVERLQPQENFAALLGARAGTLASDELVLRARADLDGGHPREAALQARVALEAVLAELAPARAGAEVLGELEADRKAVGEAANAALDGEPAAEMTTAVADAVERMERALRRHRATSPSA